MTLVPILATSLFAQVVSQGLSGDGSRAGSDASNAAQPARPAPPKPAQSPPDLPEGSEIVARKRPELPGAATDKYLAPNATLIDANDVLDEMLDQLAADVARLGPARVGPILLERVRLSDNLNPDFATVLEARLAAAVARATEVALVRCAECWATRGRLESGAWVVSRGVNRKEEMTAVAQKYAARTLLTVALTLLDEPSTLAMDVELVRADDSSIAFAEQYRMNPETALLYRGVDRTQSRASRLKELQDRIDQRPRFNQTLDLGVMGLQTGGSVAWGAVGRYALTEQFGDDGVGEAGIEAGGYANTAIFSAGLFGGVVRLRVSPSQLFASDVRLVAHGGGVLTPGATSLYGGAGIRWKPAVRVSVFGMIDYIVPFQVRKDGPKYGELSPQFGVGFTWP
ncbi:MAG TPA: hypothetical protein VEQ15_09975 [Myxococcales bacterium]|nr:hypothetical protein [Myxococcales bacterium]